MDSTDKELKRYFRNIFGCRIYHPDLFKVALLHRSMSAEHAVFGRINNERLEYLGDAILGAVMADFLFRKYPLESEGVLTQMRSKLVNRARLNTLARKLGLDNMVRIDGHISSVYANGNAFEAVVGAIYLDQGYKKTQEIIIKHIYLTHLDIDSIYDEEDDYKSRILIWAQKQRRVISFQNEPTKDEKDKLYRSGVVLDGEEVAFGLGFSVKKAEQLAAEKAWTFLGAQDAND